jgi:Flp pilus assembly protein TadG
MKRTRWPLRFVRNEHGAVTIEFVVMLPVFLAALAFSYEFGQLFLAQQSTINNVRAAGRYLARVELNGTNENNAERIIRRGVLSGGTTPDYMVGVCQAPNPDCITFDGDTIDIVVRVNYPLSIFGFIDSNAPATLPFTIHEHYRWVGM